MKKLLITLCLSGLFIAYPVTAEDSNNLLLEATVVNHLDGDTIDVLVNGESKRLKMLGVDTPEIRLKNKPVEFYGKEAKQYTEKNLSLNSTVYLQTIENTTDKYGRLQAYLWYQKPKNSPPNENEIKQFMHNAKLLANGYAKIDKTSLSSEYNNLFANLEKTAKKNHWGVWSKINKTKNLSNPKKVKPVERTIQQKPKAPTINTNNPSTTQGMIKGNINSKGEKIYHLPGQAHYDRTIAEAYFATESEAQAQGYRRSRR